MPVGLHLLMGNDAVAKFERTPQLGGGACAGGAGRDEACHVDAVTHGHLTTACSWRRFAPQLMLEPLGFLSIIILRRN